jgi:hypothetical protein
MEEKCPLSYSQRQEKLGEFSSTSKCLFIFIFFSFFFFYFFFFIIFIIFFSSSGCRSNAHQATFNVKSNSMRILFHPPSSFSSSSSSSPRFSPSIYSSYASLHVLFAGKKFVELLSTSKKA